MLDTPVGNLENHQAKKLSSYYTSGAELLILSGYCAAPPVWGLPDDHMLDAPLGGLDM